ncbi:FAD-dependent oxidoreductase [Ensifer soli]|uniref:FAD-dependent oxidoreductase n=1 Tax=Ciceribacter sp. sgz301302 TaxID=3342379 RepID=UPI0035BA75E5
MRHAAIVGAGIAGLTAALSLARKGWRVVVIEKAAQLSETGAGLQLSPNATHILDRLGLLPVLARDWLEPETIRLCDGATLKPVAAVSTGAFARDRWGAPYAALSRAALHSALLDAVRASPSCRLVTGCAIGASDPAREIATVTGDAPALVVGADGLRSTLRRHVPQAGLMKPAGVAAWRLVVPPAEAPEVLDRSNVAAFLGPGAHLVSYPMGGARGFNIVAITAAPADGDDAAGRATLRAAFSSWHPSLRSLLDRPENEIGVWLLHGIGEGRWQDGNATVLIGDAAHAMMPFAAQGAAMAIEDAFELATFVSRGDAVAPALAAFEAHRRPRIRRVRARGDFNRFAYHARGPVRLGRDIVLSLRGPERLASGFDWLYGYRARD